MVTTTAQGRGRPAGGPRRFLPLLFLALPDGRVRVRTCAVSTEEGRRLLDQVRRGEPMSVAGRERLLASALQPPVEGEGALLGVVTLVDPTEDMVAMWDAVTAFTLDAGEAEEMLAAAALPKPWLYDREPAR